MDGYERRKERKQEDIRRAAIELFKTYGFDRVSVGDIASRAGVSHVTIYNHFGSKDELVRDVVRTVIADLVAKSREIIRGEADFLEKLELIVLDKAEVASQYRGELARAVRENPEMRQYVESLWENEIGQLLLELVAEGKRLGYIRQEILPEAVLYYFEIIRNGAYVSSELLNRIKPDAELARQLNHLFLYGLVDKKE